MSRTCMHCVLAHALRVESARLASQGIAVVLGRSEALWLPASGACVYRVLHRFLRDVVETAGHQIVKLVVVDLLGKSHVEVMAVVGTGKRSRVLKCAFPRHALGTLSRGFREGWDVATMSALDSPRVAGQVRLTVSSFVRRLEEIT